MFRRITLAGLCALTLCIGLAAAKARAEQHAFGQVWGGAYSNQDWERFYHYPYVFYPQNFWGNEYYRSSENLYYRYPPEMRVPVYNRQWHNFYPRSYHNLYPGTHRYLYGHHMILDVF